MHQMELLIELYKQILTELKSQSFNLDHDKYSGVFLPVLGEEYQQAPCKIMLVGRETSGWNTKNNKNTMLRALGRQVGITLDDVIEEAIVRYKKHQDDIAHMRTSRSHFMRYHLKLARELNLTPQAIMYANLLAWDYDFKTPLRRPREEREEVIAASLKMLEAQIKHSKPDFVIFASGIKKTGYIVKRLLKLHLNGYETVSVDPGRLWEFKSGGATCFQIAHPRAMRDHKKCRERVIERIKFIIAEKNRPESDLCDTGIACIQPG